MAGQFPAREGEVVRDGAIDAAATGGAEGCGHEISGFCSFRRYTLWNR